MPALQHTGGEPWTNPTTQQTAVAETHTGMAVTLHLLATSAQLLFWQWAEQHSSSKVHKTPVALHVVSVPVVQAPCAPPLHVRPVQH